jgi:hypothetical protein
MNWQIEQQLGIEELAKALAPHSSPPKIRYIISPLHQRRKLLCLYPQKALCQIPGSDHLCSRKIKGILKFIMSYNDYSNF